MKNDKLQAKQEASEEQVEFLRVEEQREPRDAAADMEEERISPSLALEVPSSKKSRAFSLEINDDDDDSIELAPEDELQQEPTSSHLLRKARRLLYLSHLFSQFSEIAWQFCLILFLGAFANYESLIFVSTYGLISGLAVCLSGGWVGGFIDSSNRLLVAQRFIWAENISVLLATSFCYVLLKRARTVQDPEPSLEESIGADEGAMTTTEGDSTSSSSWLEQCLKGVPLDIASLGLLLGIHVLGSIARMLDRGFLVSIERDWVVVMSRLASSSYSESSEKDDHHRGPDAEEKAWLSETNVAMKQIDLSCKVVGPAVAGFFIAAFDDGTDPHHGGDLTGAALLVGAINVAALIVEYICTLKIYYMIPDLAFKAPSSALIEGDNDEQMVGPGESAIAVHAAKTKKPGCGFCKLPFGLGIYLEQQISMGGLGLALLYLNALSFSAIMTAYLVWRGMRLETVGVWRGVSCAVGLFGTFVYHQSVRYMSLESTGMWSIAFQFLCLSLSYVSLFVDSYTTSLAMLIGGVCASRIGLWVFDIALTQMMQEYIPSTKRGVVGGVQESLNAFFELLSFGLGIVVPDPRNFHIYVSAGYASVALALLFYFFGVYLRRDKLISR